MVVQGTVNQEDPTTKKKQIRYPDTPRRVLGQYRRSLGTGQSEDSLGTVQYWDSVGPEQS